MKGSVGKHQTVDQLFSGGKICEQPDLHSCLFSANSE